MKKHLIVLSLIFLVFSCKKDQAELDMTEIEEYVAEKGLDGAYTDEGIFYVIHEPGGDAKPNGSHTITADYEGKYTDDVIFDSSYERGEPLEFTLNRVIAGWQIGIPLIGKGGAITLVIPSEYAYGSNPPFPIRENAVMVFDVELLDFM